MHKSLFLALLLVGPGGSEPELTVHEWGTFTSIAGDTGHPVPWRPLNGPSDLPTFVYRAGNGERELGKAAYFTTVRMETPVLYFYTDRERDVAVKVDFPNGRITEWYPKAATTRGGIDWGTIRVRPGTSPRLPREDKPSHYYPAREVDAAPVQVGAENEKLLFYRGVGAFPLPIQARLHTDDQVVLRAVAGPVQGVVLFENRGGRIGWRTVGRLEDKALVERPALGRSLPELRAELERMLTAEGLFAKEAAAMLETWKDSWFEEGLRAMYLVPRAATDKILPLTLNPKPRSCVRVLVGRIELITPAFADRIEGLVEQLDAPRADDRAKALKDLKATGRFAQPVVERLWPTVKTKDSRDKLGQILYR